MKNLEKSPVTLTRLFALPLAIFGVFLFLWTDNRSHARDDGELLPIDAGRYDNTFDELSAEERDLIWADLEVSRADLKEQGILPMGGNRIVGFDLPLRSAEKSIQSDFEPWFIANYIDHNPAYPNATIDYNCGERTYDSWSGYNHQGIDFFLWPTPWRQMEAGSVEVVAAAPSVIIKKIDGNYDKQCSIGSATWNAVYVEHADGSIAWYGHLKTGSLTDKEVGDTLTRGEYIGLVGSSGRSTGPHLHFEVYDSDGDLIDPYSGGCNDMNDRSWWLTQKPYVDSAITGILVGTTAPVSNGCGLVETVSEQPWYTPGSDVVFTVYFRDHRPGIGSEFKLLEPDGSIYRSWYYNGPSYEASALWASWNRTLGDEEGTWELEISYAGQIWVETFEVREPVGYEVTVPTSVSLVGVSAEKQFNTAGGLLLALTLSLIVRWRYVIAKR